MRIKKTWENVKQNPKSYKSFIIKSLAILALVSFSIIALSCMLAPADKVDQIENSNFEGRTLGLIDFGNDLSNCEPNYYFLRSTRNNKVLDVDKYDTDRIYMSKSTSDATKWKICRGSQDLTFTLYSKQRKGFLDGGLSNIYVRSSYDWEISDFARWKLDPVTQSGYSNYVQIVNVGRINSGSNDRYLDSNTDYVTTSALPYLSPYSTSIYTYWTLVQTT